MKDDGIVVQRLAMILETQIPVHKKHPYLLKYMPQFHWKQWDLNKHDVKSSMCLSVFLNREPAGQYETPGSYVWGSCFCDGVWKKTLPEGICKVWSFEMFRKIHLCQDAYKKIDIVIVEGAIRCNLHVRFGYGFFTNESFHFPFLFCFLLCQSLNCGLVEEGSQLLRGKTARTLGVILDLNK